MPEHLSSFDVAALLKLSAFEESGSCLKQENLKKQLAERYVNARPQAMGLKSKKLSSSSEESSGTKQKLLAGLVIWKLAKQLGAASVASRQSASTLCGPEGFLLQRAAY